MKIYTKCHLLLWMSLCDDKLFLKYTSLALNVQSPKKYDFSLDILNILQMAIQFFDKDIIYNAFDRLYKIADELYVDG